MNEEELKALAQKEAEDLEAKKNLNQSANRDNNNYSKIRKDTEDRYKLKLEKQQKSHEEELKHLNDKFEFKATVEPKILEEFIKHGGNKDNFNDFMKIHTGNIDTEKIATSIKELSKTTQWAFQENKQNSSVQEQFKAGTENGKAGTVDNSEYEPGQVYKKRK